MENNWRPIAELRPGHYAVGRLADGHEADIYRAGTWLIDVATGKKIAGVIACRSLQIRPGQAANVLNLSTQ